MSGLKLSPLLCAPRSGSEQGSHILEPVQNPCLPHSHLPAERLRGSQLPKECSFMGRWNHGFSQGLQMCALASTSINSEKQIISFCNIPVADGCHTD